MPDMVFLTKQGLQLNFLSNVGIGEKEKVFLDTPAPFLGRIALE